MLSSETRQQILELQQLYPNKRSALIPALHVAQAEIGYLPVEAQAEVAELFDIQTNEVHAIVSFYDMFFEKPVGKHLLHVCKNVSCMLRGADEIIHDLCEKLDIKPGETTADGEFTLIASECLAACDRAPMMLADDKIIGHINRDELQKILEEAKKGIGHPSPVNLTGEDHA